MKVLVDGTVDDGATVRVDYTTGVPGVVVKLPPQGNPGSSLQAELDPDPQLRILDHTSAISSLIVDLKIENQVENSL